ncbi:MAG TPA: Rossmann fold nucleotide-binding protein, partial [Nocardioides sp.]|nr:Rossmann fold nucleotide-binding protein [Nocardioides sp.]
MKRSRGRVVQVETLAEFDQRVAAGATRLSGWRVRGVDLTDRGSVLAGLRLGGATFLGCTFASGEEERV